MSRVYRNQVLISNKNYNLGSSFCKNVYNNIIVYTDINVPIIKFNNGIFIGWGINTINGKTLSVNDFQNVTANNFYEKTESFSGRFICLIDGEFLFTDPTSSFPVYYSGENVSTNLALISSVENYSIFCEDKSGEILILPPGTGVHSIKRLIPGQYLNIGNMKAVSIVDYLVLKNNHNDDTLSEISNILINSASGIINLTNDDYRHMLTAGKDSRLSLLAFMGNDIRRYKSFTHKKKVFLNDVNDIKTPKILSKLLGFDHQITRATNNDFTEAMALETHAPFISKTHVPGSTYYYYKMSNWFQIKEEFLIDNYYEIGRMHLHNKGVLKTAEHISVKNILESGYIIDEDDFLELVEHIKVIAGNIDELDVFYFIKNYINVANQFEMIDFSHSPLIFNNSLRLFRLLLSISETERADGKFHDELLKYMTMEEYMFPECNKDSHKISYRLFNRIRKELGKYFG